MDYLDFDLDIQPTPANQYRVSVRSPAGKAQETVALAYSCSADAILVVIHGNGWALFAGHGGEFLVNRDGQILPAQLFLRNVLGAVLQYFVTSLQIGVGISISTVKRNFIGNIISIR